MPSIVHPSDFESGPLRIPGAVSGNAGEAANADLTAIIAKSEKEVLLRALGKTQYDAFMAGTGAPWDGLREFVKPILMLHAYCQWLRYDEVNYTTVGGGKGQAAGQSMADLNSRYVTAWNEFVDLYMGIASYQTSLYEYLEQTEGLTSDEFHFDYVYLNQFGL